MDKLIYHYMTRIACIEDESAVTKLIQKLMNVAYELTVFEEVLKQNERGANHD